MKRITAGVVAGLVLLAPLPARAAAVVADPVKALRAQVVPGRGVTVSLVTRTSPDGRRFATTRTDRIVGFRKGGVVETDDTTTFYSAISSEGLKEDTLFPSLLVRVKDATYASGGELIGRLPLNKNWVRLREPRPVAADGAIDLFTPGTLRALLATASSRGPRSARGTILASAIPGRPFEGWTGRGEKVAWALWFDAEGRVTRLASATSRHANGGDRPSLTSDQRFTGWGARVTVQPPPEDAVIEAEELPEPGSPEETPETIEILP
ncbi:hypothetical protein ACIBCT_01440 [Streptosporangium sp. NPDC050855]|uniref:hypothetical protein n=1 Tax=Streptosporangium sp. NPDC050855 TaxID=3366194 RepID=UPI0037A9EBD5